MKLTIIRPDGAVYKDSLCYSNLDLSDIPTNVHALQFNDTVNAGWIEFAEDAFGNKENNQNITSLPTWAILAMSKWNEAEVIAEAAKLAVQQASANQPTTMGTQSA